MAYTVSRIPIDDIDTIKAQWLSLWRGKDMTYHQSFGWYKMLTRFTPLNCNIDCAFFVVERDSIPVMIAPLWIVKKRFGIMNKPGVYLIGRKKFTDYLNLIYDRFDPQAFEALRQYIFAKYGDMPWHFELLKTTSTLYQYLVQESESGKIKIGISAPGTCAMLTLPASTDGYLASLSKNTRQNLRTARNRANRDGIDFVIKTDDRDIDPYVCKACREAWAERRQRVRGDGLNLKGRMVMKMKNLLHDNFLIKYPDYLPFIDDEDAKLLTITDAGNGELAAFFCYGRDTQHRQILVMTAGVNEIYTKYSPGMMCIKQLIDECISSGDIDTVDFTRGDEGYKYSLGAQSHYICNLCIQSAK